MSKLLSIFKRRKNERMCSAVIVAAGSARRMEGIDKVLAPIGEIPILVHTLRVFQQNPGIVEIIVVTREDLLIEIADICKAYKLDKVCKIVVGGSERVFSVRNGLREVRQDAGLIAIHDAARPFLSQKVLNDVLIQAERSGAAAPAIPVSDTVKRAENGIVTETMDRSCLWAIQTPQVFQADLIRAAVEKAAVENTPVTDDCSAVERLGMQVVLTEGDRENIKVTTPFDMILGRAILDARGEL